VLNVELNQFVDALGSSGASVVWLKISTDPTIAEVGTDKAVAYDERVAALQASHPGLSQYSIDTSGVALLYTTISPRRRTIAPPATPSENRADAVQPLPPAPAAGPRATPSGSEPERVLVVGDSIAFGYAEGMKNSAPRDKSLIVTNGGQFRCPLARGGRFRFLTEVMSFEDSCDWFPKFSEWIKDQRPHIVLLSSAVWDVVDRILPGDTKWRHIGDQTFDNYYLRELLTAIDLCSSGGAKVVMVTNHHIDAGANLGFSDLPESDPARIDRLNALMAQAASLRPDVTSVVDLAGWVAAQTGGELDPQKLKDGVHYNDAYLDVIGRWLDAEMAHQVGR
jgi:hypothetical protein